MNLDFLLQKIALRISFDIKNFSNFEVEFLTPDSRLVQKNSIFFAIKGSAENGNKFSKNAIQNGAKAIVSDFYDSELPKNITQIVTKEPRKFLSLLSSVFFDEPSKKLNLVGVTGTSGKTSTAYILRAIFNSLGIKNSMIGTTGYYIDEKFYPPDFLPATTPESFYINKMLKESLDSGAKYVFSEISSFALSLDRVYGINFDTGIFTNFSQDHLGYHKTMEEYLKAKLILFQNLGHDKFAILNKDDDAYEDFKNATKAKIFSYSLKEKADLYIDNFTQEANGISFVLNSGKKMIKGFLSLEGTFQLYNALASFSYILTKGLDLEEAVNSVSKPIYIPGRFERIDEGQPFTVIVDYAHTPEEFKVLFEAVNRMKTKKKIIVFGSVGRDDRIKRPIMGKMATEYADHVIVTVEDPRGEDEHIAVDDIIKGISKDNFEVAMDRSKAIAKGISLAREGDIVLILGRGHEHVMYYKDKEIFLDDRIVSREILNNSEWKRNEV